MMEALTTPRRHDQYTPVGYEPCAIPVRPYDGEPYSAWFSAERKMCIVIGNPPDEDDSAADFEAYVHNCDANGCGWEHVLARLPMSGRPAGLIQMSESKSNMGCCVDKACSPETCMVLPDGKMCGDCAHVKRCTAFGFTASAAEVACDFFPRRAAFVVEPTERQVATARYQRIKAGELPGAVDGGDSEASS